MDDNSNIVQLIGEDGQPEEFEHIMTLEWKDNYYVVLHPMEGEASEDEENVVILRIEVEEETGEDTYVFVEDEQEANAVFMEFVALLEMDEEGEPEE